MFFILLGKEIKIWEEGLGDVIFFVWDVNFLWEFIWEIEKYCRGVFC